MSEHNRFGEAAMQARLAKKLTLRKAAGELQIDPSYLSKIELGRCEPPPGDVIRRLAKLYDCPIDDLLRHARTRTREVIAAEIDEDKVLQQLVKLYRTAGESDSEVANEGVEAIFKLIHKLPPAEREKFINKVKLDFTRVVRGHRDLFAARIKPRVLSRATIRRIAHKFLASHSLTEATYKPPTPIEYLIESTPGIRLHPSDSEDMKCDMSGSPIVLGLSKYDTDGKTRLIEINRSLYVSEREIDRYRLNFTLAHELFHAIEHLPLVEQLSRESIGLFRLVEFDPLQRDRWCDQKRPKRKFTTNEHWQEWQAQQFAAEVLMPSWSVEKEFVSRYGTDPVVAPSGTTSAQFADSIAGASFVSGRMFIPLHRKYGVSRQAMGIRLMNLDLIDA